MRNNTNPSDDDHEAEREGDLHYDLVPLLTLLLLMVALSAPWFIGAGVIVEWFIEWSGVAA